MGKSATDVLSSVQLVTSSHGVVKKESSSGTGRRQTQQRKWRQLRALLYQLKEARETDEIMIQQLRFELEKNHGKGVNTQENEKLKKGLAAARQDVERLRKENSEQQRANAKLQKENTKIREQSSNHDDLKNEILWKKKKINLAIEKCEKYKTKNQNLEARLRLCTCKMSTMRPRVASSQEYASAATKEVQATRRPKRPTKKAKQSPSEVQQSAAVAGMPPLPTTKEEDPRMEAVAAEELPAEKLPVPMEITTVPATAPKKIDPKLKSMVQYWDEEEQKARMAAEEAAKARKAAEEAAKAAAASKAASRSGSDMVILDETSEESLAPLPKPVVSTKIPGFFVQESPAEAWKRRKEERAQKKGNKTKIKVHVDPWKDRFKRKEPEVKAVPEFLKRANKIGHVGREYVVEAKGNVAVGAGVIVTAKGIEYTGQAAIDRAEAAKRAREEAEQKELEEEEERERKAEEAAIQRELEEEAEKKRQDEEERRQRTEQRAREIAERQAREAAQKAEREAAAASKTQDDAAAKKAQEEAAAKKAEEEAAAKKAAEEADAAKKAAEAAAAPPPAAPPASTPATSPLPAPAATEKKKKSFLDSSSDEDSDDSPIVKKAPAASAPAAKKKSFFDSDSDSTPPKTAVKKKKSFFDSDSDSDSS